MFKFLLDKLVCPLCHGELEWNILEETTERIVEAHIACTSCGKEYSVKEQIANFLIEEVIENDLWQAGEDYLDIFFKENSAMKEKLMTASLEEMTAADMYIKADILNKEGNEKEAEELKRIAHEKAYTRERLDAGDKQFEYLTHLLKDERRFVVDIASGPCTLVKQILKNTDVQVVATDFSMRIIKSAKESINKEGYSDRVTFIAFDARKTPFKNNSIPIMTSFVGLQNVDKPGDILSELRRISSGAFYSVCSFCSEEDDANRAYLRQSGAEFMWLKELHKKEFVDNHWNVEVLNSVYAKSSPTPMGKILTFVGIDGFPVADGIFEHCIVKASI